MPIANAAIDTATSPPSLALGSWGRTSQAITSVGPVRYTKASDRAISLLRQGVRSRSASAPRAWRGSAAMLASAT